MGRYSIAITFATIFVVFSDVGLSVLAVREISRNKEEVDKYISNIMLIKFALSLFTWISVAVLINIIGYPKDTKYAVYILMLAMLVNSFIEVFCAVFRAHERMGYVSSMMILWKASCAVLGIIALLTGFGLRGFVNTFLAATLITAVITFIILRGKFVKPTFNFDIGFCKRIIRDAFPIGLSMLFTNLYFRLDIILLSMMKGDAVVGWYNAAFKPLEMLQLIPYGFIGALFPIFSNLHKESKQSLLFLTQKAIKALIVIIVPIAVGATALADKFIPLFYGKGFNNSIIVLQIITWAAVFMFVNYALTHVIISIDKQRYYAIFCFACAVFNIVLNLLLIPMMSYIGISLVKVATEVVLFVLCFWVVSRNIGIIPIHKMVFKPVIAGAMMGLFILFVKENQFLNSISTGWSLLIIVLLSMVLYLAVLRLIKVLDTDDYKILKSLFKKV